ncbi:MAG: hypothetical protein H0W49_07490 [Nitrospirales bacterium]|nr:hypothetical protein [Nitrospirales bacterium]
MNKTIMAVGISAIMMSVAPAFAMEAETQTNFRALEGFSPSAPMNDSELAAIEGQAPPQLIAQRGLVNVGAQLRVGDVRVIRDITIQDVNVQILSAGIQR